MQDIQEINRLLPLSETRVFRPRRRDVTKGPSEAQIQKAFFEWVRMYPRVDQVTFAIPNGGRRDKKEALNLKRQGVKAGVPDIFIGIPSQGFHGAFIELKRKGGKVSESQQTRMLYLSKHYKCYVCDSGNWEDVKRFVEEYLGDMKQYRPFTSML